MYIWTHLVGSSSGSGFFYYSTATMAYNRTRGLAAETSLYPQAEQSRTEWHDLKKKKPNRW